MRLTLATKVTATIAGVLALAVMSSSVALVSAYQISGLMQRLVIENLDSVVAAEELEIALLEQRGFVTSFILDDGNRQWLNELADREPSFERWLARARASAYTPEERDILSQLQLVFKEYDRKRDEAVALFDQGDRDAAKRLVLQDVKIVYDQAFRLCEDFLEANQRIVQLRTSQASTHMRNLTFVVGACVAVTLGAGAGLLWLFFSGVLLPLRRMAAEARRVAGADRSDDPIPEDELRTVGLFLRSLMSDVVQTKAHLERSHEQLMSAEKLASVGKLAASVAHEIRNPLTAVKMWLFSLRKNVGDDPELVPKFDIIAEEINRLESIIRNFLQFSRPPELALKSQSVSNLIDKTLELLAHRMDECRVSVRRVDGSQLPEVRADGEQIKQVLINVVSNAMEAMPDGGEIRITAECGTQQDGVECVVVRIRDSGAGMPADARARIFEPFFTTKENGTGLGLCIAARIMERHGGRLVLESSSERGTTFAVWVPVERS